LILELSGCGLRGRHVGQGRIKEGRERIALGVRSHANQAQIWAGFWSPRTPWLSVFGMRPRVVRRICSVRTIRAHGRGKGRPIGDVLI
jgi:hypothetical protein